jgi:hypothetical protein
MFRTQSPRPPASLDCRQTPRHADAGIAAPARIRRERDFGVGYGNSSGYASNRRYAPVEIAGYFRCR